MSALTPKEFLMKTALTIDSLGSGETKCLCDLTLQILIPGQYFRQI